MTLPVGTYTLTGSGSARAILEGNSEMVLEINSQTIEITESTTSINVTVTPLVALILVADEDQLINECYCITVTDAGTTQTIDLNTNFVVEDLVTW